MSGVANDIKSYEYDANPGLDAYGVAANAQLYVGAVALVSGGSGSITQGYLKNAATAFASDIVAGVISEPSGGTYVQTGPGILGGSADGNVWVLVKTGTFLVQSGTGADTLSMSTVGKTVYYGGENAVGPIACATGAGTRPIIGVQLPQDPGWANGFAPGSTYFPIKMSQIGGPYT